MKPGLLERPSQSRSEPDPLAVLLHADDVREGCRLVMTERRYRWIKQLQWWKDLSEQLEKRGRLVGN